MNAWGWWVLPCLCLLNCGGDEKSSPTGLGFGFGALCSAHTDIQPSAECGDDLVCLTDNCGFRCTALCDGETEVCPSGYLCDTTQAPGRCYPSTPCNSADECGGDSCVPFVKCPLFNNSYCIPASYGVEIAP